MRSRPTQTPQRGIAQLALRRYPPARVNFGGSKRYRWETGWRSDLAFFLGVGVPDSRTIRPKARRACIICVRPGGRLWTVGSPLPCFPAILTVTSEKPPLTDTVDALRRRQLVVLEV